MPIPVNLAYRQAYHFSHISNLPGLIQDGFLANNHPNFPRCDHRSIAAKGIQQRRAQMPVPCGPGGCVHDYVPLYFGSRSPMLLSVIQAKNVDQYDILYFEFPIALADGADAVFTDASANTLQAPNFYHDAADLTKLDWPAIDSLKWGNVDEDFRHRRMAELLVRNQLPVTAATRCVVWNDNVKKRVETIVNNRPFPPIELETQGRRHWFTDFANKKKSSLVMGPGEISLHYRHACSEIAKHRGQSAATAAFANLQLLLLGLRANFGCLPHTAELVGLRSANGLHKQNVDTHTKEVVARLVALPRYLNLQGEHQRLVELASYLHDIGKGPRSRWDGNNGLQKVDPNHPVGAMPMMIAILTQHVGDLDQLSANILTKLVCYHDLVGDVLGNGRDEQQIVDVVDNKEELDMLFALGQADATALVERWWDDVNAQQLYDRCLGAIVGKARG